MKKFSLLTLSCLLTLGLKAQDRTFKLQLNLDKGQDYYLNTETLTQINQEVMGQSVEVDRTYKSRIRYKVTDIQGDQYDLKITTELLSTSTEGGSMEPQAYSSESGEEDQQMNVFLKALTQAPMKVKVAKDGTIAAPTSDGSYWADALSNFVQDGEDLPEAAVEQLKAITGPEAMARFFQKSFSYLPPKEVSLGEQWSVDDTQITPIQLNITGNYKLVEVTEAYALIAVDLTLSTPDGGDTIKQMAPMSMIQTLTGNTHGQFKIDLKSGWIIEGHTDQKLEGEIKMEANAQLPETLAIPIVTHSSTKINSTY